MSTSPSRFRRTLRQTLTIARRDFVATVFTPIFLLFLFAPVIMGSFGAIGGLGAASVADGAVTSLLPLPVAGLLSAEDADAVCRGLDEGRRAALALGCPLAAPFGTLSFLALPVIPELRITTRGLFDLRDGRFLAM